MNSGDLFQVSFQYGINIVGVPSLSTAILKQHRLWKAAPESDFQESIAVIVGMAAAIWLLFGSLFLYFKPRDFTTFFTAILLISLKKTRIHLLSYAVLNLIF